MLDAVTASGERLFFISIHTGNFELGAAGVRNLGIDLAAFFRPPRNPYLAAILAGARERANILAYARSTAGTRAAVRHFEKSGGALGAIIDERHRGGLQIPSFGRPVARKDALDNMVRLIERDRAVLLAGRSLRSGPRVRLVGEPIVEVPRRPDGTIDGAALRSKVDAITEKWVRDRPEEWLWLQHWAPPHARPDHRAAMGPSAAVPSTG